MKFLLQWFKLFLVNVVGLFRRALCCFSRRRKLSFRSDSPLHSIDVVVNSTNAGQLSNKQQKVHPERDWNSWDDSPRTVEEHIEQYRQRLTRPATPPPPQPEPDLFKELTPVIKPQPKYYLGGPEEEKVNFTRLQANVDVPITMNAELEDWEEDDVNGDWEELDSQQAKQMIREKRREMRYQRQRETRTNGIAENTSYGIATNHSRSHT